MGDQHELFIPEHTHALAPRWESLYEQACIRANKKLSDNTKNTYAASLKSWVTWCDHFDEVALPIQPDAFAAYLEWLATEGAARDTIRTRMMCLSAIDARNRLRPNGATPPDTLVRAAVVRDWWGGYCRDHPQRLGRAPRVTRQEITQVISHAFGLRSTPTRLVTRTRLRALLLLGYMGAFRRSEIARVRVGEIESVPRGIWVHWPTSKNDPTSKGESRLILPQRETIMCAVDAWHEWRAILEMGERMPDAPPHGSDAIAFPALIGPRITGLQVRDRAIYRTVTKAAADAGVRMSPHSLRAAFATHASEKHEEGEVAHHGRWKSRISLKHYVDRGKGWIKNPTSGLTIEPPIPDPKE